MNKPYLSYIAGAILLFFTLYSCDWYAKSSAIQLEPEAFNTKIKKGNVQLIDVRTPKEYKEGHIKAAVNINYHAKNFKDSLKVLDATKPVYIYCRSGKRSSSSVTDFRAVGFDSIYELEGGMLNWRNKGFKANIE